MKKIKITRMQYIFISFLIFLVLFIFSIIFFQMRQKSKITLEMGELEIIVRDIDNVKTFYKELVGLDVMAESPIQLKLGSKGNLVLIITESKLARPTLASEPGLYHVAFVYKERAELADAIDKILTTTPQLYQGSSDHIATEAFYFSDPEGNGVELYFDKPRSDWQFGPDGKPLMGSSYIDERQYITKYGKKNSVLPDMTVGHMHLKIGDIEQAENFYVDILKFDLISKMDSALFVSKDNYHHHIGMNTWQSAGAVERTENTLGLKEFIINVTDSTWFNEVKNSLTEAQVEYKINEDQNLLTVTDPWGNVIKFRGE